MKSRKLLICLLPFLLICTACNQDNSYSNDGLENRIATLEEENKALKQQLKKNNKIGIETGPEENNSVTEEDKSSENQLTINQSVIIENFVEFTLKNINVSKKVMPPKVDEAYSYYEVDKEGNIYIDITLSLKNLQTTKQDASEFLDVKVIYDGKYEYDTFPVIESFRGTSFRSASYVYIDPLLLENLHFLAEVPESITKDEKAIEILVSVEGETYKYKFK